MRQMREVRRLRTAEVGFNASMPEMDAGNGSFGSRTAQFLSRARSRSKGPLSDQVADAPDACGQWSQLCRFDSLTRGHPNGRNRRISSVAECFHQGPLTEPTADMCTSIPLDRRQPPRSRPRWTPCILWRQRRARRAASIRCIPRAAAQDQVGALCQEAVRRAAGRARLPVALHPPRRHLQSPADRSRQDRGHFHLEGLPDRGTWPV
jgi:hypothetical protein